MRLFVGLRPAETFRAALKGAQDRLRAAGVEGRYLDPANLHLTLAFIGEWPEDVTPVLPAVTEPFEIELAGPGIFPAAKVLWAGVKPSAALDRLAGEARDRLAANRIPFDPKPFNPHITLVRKPSVPAGLDLAKIPVPSASMAVEEVCLYRSDHEENGIVYTVIGSSGKKE